MKRPSTGVRASRPPFGAASTGPRSRFHRLRWLLALLVPVLLFLAIPVPTKALSVGRVPSIRLLDRHGFLLREVLSSEQGTAAWSPLDQISPDVIEATLVAEDRRFWSHPGIDPIGLGRAVVQNLRNHAIVSGASTVAMQLIANAYGREHRGLGFKLWEGVAALRLMSVASHREVLERYLNTIPYGHQAFGIEAAARTYFDRPASRLSLAQAAYLAAIPCSPSLYDPLGHPDAVKDRERWILEEMRRLGKASPERVAAALAEDVRIDLGGDRFLAPHFCDLAREKLEGRSGEVRTTLDATLQRDLEAMLRTHLIPLRDRGATNGAIVVLDNETGDILAMVGSVDFASAQFNGATALRQPGSTLKPFTYGLALQNGMTASTLIPDLPARYRTGTVEYTPMNYDGTFHGPVRMRTALACSYNAAAVKVLSEIGPEALLDVLHRAGFDSLDKPASHYGLGLTLGGGEVTLLELAGGFRSLARGGTWSPQRIFLDAPQRSSRTVFSPRVCAILTDILSDPDARTPAFGAHSVLNMPFPCAAKTGTSRDFRDNWTVGYTTRYTVAIWVGDFGARPMQQVSGVTGAGRLFRSVMLHLHDGNPPKDFPVPGGLVRLSVCPDSGDLPGPCCSSHVSELFIAAYVPTQTCRVHRMMDGRRATVYPAQYADWMHEVGLPLPSQAVPDGHPGIISPQEGDAFRLDPVLHADYQTLRLNVVPPSGAVSVDWYVDGRLLEVAGPPFAAHWRLARGTHTIEARTAPWRSAPVHVSVF